MKLARLQQVTTLSLLLLAVTWAVGAWRAGAPGWALGGALFIVFAYATFLALELALMRGVHGADPAPRARWSQLAAAWWHEVGWAPRIFCWQQPFRSRRWPDHLPPAAAGRCGVLLVHGFVCNRGFWNDWMARLQALGVPYVAVDLEPVFGAIDDYVAAIEEGVRKLEAATGRPPIAVAHSMGGLALRAWWARQNDAARLAHAITLGAPHHGTWLARYAMSPNGRQMQRGSPWLAALAEHEGGRIASRLTCFYSHCDNVVFPASTAAYPGADNRHLVGCAHVQMAGRPEPWHALRARLEAEQRQAPAAVSAISAP